MARTSLVIRTDGQTDRWMDVSYDNTPLALGPRGNNKKKKKKKLVVEPYALWPAMKW